MKIALTTLGCKLNYAETSTYERGFLAHGLEVVPWNTPADVYLINTCAVTETAEKKSRNLMRRAHKTAPLAPVIVTGCYAELKKEKLLEIEGVARVFGAREKNRVVPETLALLEGKTAEAPSEEILPAYSSGERTRSFLKVQDGCDNFCAYCTVPFARGRSRNIPICEVVMQARQIAAKGIREIVLTGVNTGDFGRSSGESFLDLLKALDAVEGIDRYRISSIEPNLITEEIVDWIASGTKFQRHFHIPLQTGSDTLLRKVGRRYDTALFASRIDYIRRKMERLKAKIRNKADQEFFKEFTLASGDDYVYLAMEYLENRYDFQLDDEENHRGRTDKKRIKVDADSDYMHSEETRSFLAKHAWYCPDEL